MRTQKRTQNELQRACRALREVLLADLALGRRMLANALAQQEALVANDHRRVADIESAGQSIVMEQEANSVRRQIAIRTLADACGIECADGDPLPRLGDLALHLPLPEARSLVALRTSILEAEEQIRTANDQNRVLVQNALDVVAFTFHALTDLALRQPAYGTNPAGVAAPTFYLDHRA